MKEKEMVVHRERCVDAVQRGDTRGVAETLRRYPKLRSHSPFVLPVSEEAIEQDDLATLRLFEDEIRRDAQSDDPYGADSLICSAAEKGRLELLQFLVSCEVDINAEGTAGFQPFGLAVRENHFDVAQFLLRAGVEFKYDAIEHNLLFKAIYAKDIEKVQWLLENGYDPHVIYRHSGGFLRNALEIAVTSAEPSPPIIDLLESMGCRRPIEGRDQPLVDYTAKNFQTIRSEEEFAAFFDAIRNCDTDHVKRFCATHTFFMEEGQLPSDAWDCAARSGHAVIAEALHVKYRDWLNHRVESLHRFGAFLTAIRCSNVEFAEVTFQLELVLEQEAHFDNSLIQTNPVFISVANGQPEALEWLIANGFDLHLVYRLSNGQVVNALTFAMQQNQQVSVELLRKAGCKPPRRLRFRKPISGDESDESKLFVTPRIHCLNALYDRLPREALKRLESVRPAQGQEDLRREMIKLAAETGQTSFLAAIVETIEGDAQLKRDCLSKATRRGHLEVVQLLVDSGADANAFDPKSIESSLMKSAICNGHLDLAQYYHELGIDLPADPPREHAIFWAMDINRHDIVQWLLTTGIDADATYQKRDGSVANALSVARDNYAMTEVRLLEEAGCRAP